MTKPSMALSELAEKGADADLSRTVSVRPRALWTWTSRGCARPPTAGEARIGRTAETATATAAGIPRRECRSQDPKLRQGSYFRGSSSRVGPPRRPRRGDPGGLRPGRVDRSVDELVKAMGMSGISKSQVQAVHRDRRAGGCVPEPPDRRRLAVSVDRYDLREGARGREDRLGGRNNRRRRNTDGQREVLGMSVGASEAEPFWTSFLRR